MTTRLLMLGLAIVLLAGAGCAAPSGEQEQVPEQVVRQMLDARVAGRAADSYWRAETADVAKEMAKFPAEPDYEILDVSEEGNVAFASVRVTPDEGTPLLYRVRLERTDWQVTGVESDWSGTP